jgi:hypothetical protein
LLTKEAGVYSTLFVQACDGGVLGAVELLTIQAIERVSAGSLLLLLLTSSPSISNNSTSLEASFFRCSLNVKKFWLGTGTHY